MKTTPTDVNVPVYDKTLHGVYDTHITSHQGRIKAQAN